MIMNKLQNENLLLQITIIKTREISKKKHCINETNIQIDDNNKEIIFRNNI